MQNVLASFDTPDEVARAIGDLAGAGFERRAITVMSAEPVNLGEHSDDKHHKSRAGWFAVAGGLLGAAAAVLLTTYTSRSVGVVTGGMPIVTPWAFGIVVFEMTALGAILALFMRMVWEAGLLRPGGAKLYDSAVADGKLLIAVSCDGDAAVERAVGVLGSQRVLRND
jgi:hypothetical protein